MAPLSSWTINRQIQTLVCRSEFDTKVSRPEHRGQNLPSQDRGNAKSQECKTWDPLVEQAASNADKGNLRVWGLGCLLPPRARQRPDHPQAASAPIYTKEERSCIRMGSWRFHFTGIKMSSEFLKTYK